MWMSQGSAGERVEMHLKTRLDSNENSRKNMLEKEEEGKVEENESQFLEFYGFINIDKSYWQDFDIWVKWRIWRRVS